MKKLKMDTECSPTPCCTSSGCKEETRADAEERIGFMQSMEEEEQELPVVPMEAEEASADEPAEQASTDSRKRQRWWVNEEKDTAVGPNGVIWFAPHVEEQRDARLWKGYHWELDEAGHWRKVAVTYGKRIRGWKDSDDYLDAIRTIAGGIVIDHKPGGNKRRRTFHCGVDSESVEAPHSRSGNDEDLPENSPGQHSHCYHATAEEERTRICPETPQDSDAGDTNLDEEKICSITLPEELN